MDHDLWSKIDSLPFEFNIKFSLTIKRNIKNIYNNILEIYSQNNIEVVYLPNIPSADEKLLYSVAKRQGIKVNFYEEGVNLYADLIKKNKFKNFIKSFLLGNKYRLYDKRENFRADKVYCCFPEKYSFKNYSKINQIKLDFSLGELERKKLKNLDIETLILSRPVSEDNLISFEREKNFLKCFFENYNLDRKKTYIKFHPRENEEKKCFIKSNFKLKELPIELSGLPAEKIVLSSDIKRLIGYSSGTLAYASELRNIEAYSFLEELPKESFELKQVYDLFKKEFKKINFIKL